MFSKHIISWYSVNKRDLPWRRTRNPYRIWLSEIILQQTRVAQGLPYYERFVETFPNIQSLAKAQEEDVLKLWQGLGYYSRARNLHKAACFVVEELKGEFPTQYKELLKLKGVGNYTAAAIASFSNDEVVPTIDGNVYRLLSRYFGIDTPIDSSKAHKEFRALAEELIDKHQPALFNQAIMEFGALQCVPASPNCSICPLRDSCVALQQNRITELPVKKSKIKIRKRYFNYLVLKTSDNKTLIKKRVGSGIWQHLYEFPLVETGGLVEFEELIERDSFKIFVGKQSYALKLFNPKPIVHKLSHQHLYIRFWTLEIKGVGKREYTDWKSILKFPFPVVIHQFIETIDKQKSSNFVE